MIVRLATPADLQDWAEMRAALHPDEGSAAEHRREVEALLIGASPHYLALIACGADGQPMAFAEATLRQDHVEDCKTSPVLFLEDIYVAQEHRRRGVASALVAAVADWGRGKGCTEFGSNALIDNVESHAFHRGAGFEETSRTVNFVQPL